MSLRSLGWPTAAAALFAVMANSGAGVVQGFTSTTITDSNGGHAKCYGGTLKVNVAAQNVKLHYQGPDNQTTLTQTFVDYLAAGSTLVQNTVGDPTTVHNTYTINGKLCYPADIDPSKVDTVQLLTHGGSLNSLYWDLPQNSYIDAAAAAGYATLAYDRLGAGASDRPDPVQEVQANLEIQISHFLTVALRNGVVDGRVKFKKVISTSHSSGNIITIGQSLKYPKDFDSLVITGFSINPQYVPPTLAAGAYEPAAASGIKTFGNLPNGYYVQSTPQSVQFLFFAFPYYDQKIFDLLYANRDTQTIGELFTLGTAVAPNPQYTGPVDVVTGEKDFIFCGANCHVPSDQTAQVQPALFPAAAKGSDHFIVPRSGHSINAHNTAPQAYTQIFDFLQKNGFAPGRGPVSQE